MMNISNPPKNTSNPSRYLVKSIGVPDCLRREFDGRQVWCNWRWEPRTNKSGETSLTKPPFQPNGMFAKNSDSTTWTSLSDVESAVAAQAFDGIGLQLGKLKGFGAIDLDDVRDPATNTTLPWAINVLQCGSYWEFTPSGTGYRVLGLLDPKAAALHRKFTHPEGGSFELYGNLGNGENNGRYITVTGVQDEAAADQLAAIDAVFDDLCRTGTAADSKSGEQPMALPALPLAALRARTWTEALENTNSEDRSADFMSAVNAARLGGIDKPEFEKVCRRNPSGVAGKYIQPRDRLNAEIDRAWSKAETGRRPIDFSNPGTPTGSEKYLANLILTSNNKPEHNYANACTMIRNHPSWQGVLAKNEFTGKLIILKPIPGSKTPTTTFKSRELRDKDITNSIEWFNRNSFPRMPDRIVREAMAAVAEEVQINPLRAYLDELTWDGGLRIGNWLSTHCGSKSDVYTKAVGRAFLVGAVARVFDPGCKHDCMPIFEGSQGTGKSTMLRILASEEYFGDALPDMTNKDSFSYLRGHWIVEIPELNAYRRSDIESVKAFLSRKEDRYRPPYGRTEISQPRQSVFAGTTNRNDYLRDETGNRRFWPITLGQIDLEKLKRDRDQFWAEAVLYYKAGLSWHLTGEAAETAVAVQKDRREDDPWTAPVAIFTQDMEEVCCRQVLLNANLDGFNREPEISRPNSHRVGGILRNLGFETTDRYTSGQFRNQAKFTRITERGK